MMSYEDNGNSVGCAPSNSPNPIMPLSSMMGQSDNMAQEILIKAYKINAHKYYSPREVRYDIKIVTRDGKQHKL